eukprot:755360-Hanusia_phi.AAC.5
MIVDQEFFQHGEGTRTRNSAIRRGGARSLNSHGVLCEKILHGWGEGKALLGLNGASDSNTDEKKHEDGHEYDVCNDELKKEMIQELSGKVQIKDEIRKKPLDKTDYIGASKELFVNLENINLDKLPTQSHAKRNEHKLWKACEKDASKRSDQEERKREPLEGTAASNFTPKFKDDDKSIFEIQRIGSYADLKVDALIFLLDASTLMKESVRKLGQDTLPLVEQLERLCVLQADGKLSVFEFSAAKKIILHAFSKSGEWPRQLKPTFRSDFSKREESETSTRNDGGERSRQGEETWEKERRDRDKREGAIGRETGRGRERERGTGGAREEKQKQGRSKGLTPVPIFDVNSATRTVRWLKEEQEKYHLMTHVYGRSYDQRHKLHPFRHYDVSTHPAQPSWSFPGRQQPSWILLPSSETPGPGQYVLPAGKTNRSTSFGKEEQRKSSDRHLLSEHADMPGPGHYVLESSWGLAGFTFGRGAMRPASVEELEGFPGPGEYNPRRVEQERGLGVSFGKEEQRPEEWEVIVARDLPGPQEYAPMMSWGGGRGGGGLGCQERFPKPSRLEVERASFPGPGEYDSRKEEAGRGFSFPRQERLPWSEEQKAWLEVPGSSAYSTIREWRGKGPSFPLEGRDLEDKVLLGDNKTFPGPGSYLLLDDSSSSPGISFGKEERRKLSMWEREQQHVPGPGTYDPQQEEGPWISFTQDEKRNRWLGEAAELSPGPGHYSCSPPPGSRGLSFGREEQRLLNGQERHWRTTPGVGAYEEGSALRPRSPCAVIGNEARQIVLVDTSGVRRRERAFPCCLCSLEQRPGMLQLCPIHRRWSRIHQEMMLQGGTEELKPDLPGGTMADRGAEAGAGAGAGAGTGAGCPGSTSGSCLPKDSKAIGVNMSQTKIAGEDIHGKIHEDNVPSKQDRSDTTFQCSRGLTIGSTNMMHRKFVSFLDKWKHTKTEKSSRKFEHMKLKA